MNSHINVFFPRTPKLGNSRNQPQKLVTSSCSKELEVTLAFSIALPAMLGGEVLVATPFAYLPALPVYLLENHPSRLVFVRTKHGKTVHLI